MLLSEDTVLALAFLYLNFLAVKQLVMAMFYDMAFHRAEKAAKLFTIDLSRKKQRDNISGANGSTPMSIACFLFYFGVDALGLTVIAWLFGASVFVKFWENIQLGLLLAVIVRESVTVCKVPDIPKISANIKTVDEARTDASDGSAPKISEASQRSNEMPGRLEQGSALLAFNPFEIWTTKQSSEMRQRYYSNEVHKIYANLANKHIQSEEINLKKLQEQIIKEPIITNWPCA